MSGSKHTGRPLGCLIRRALLMTATIAIALCIGLYLVLDLIFNGPSPTARDMLVLDLCQSEATQWIPGVFLEDEVIEQICAGAVPEEG